MVDSNLLTDGLYFRVKVLRALRLTLNVYAADCGHIPSDSLLSQDDSKMIPGCFKHNSKVALRHHYTDITTQRYTQSYVPREITTDISVLQDSFLQRYQIMRLSARSDLALVILRRSTCLASLKPR